MRRQGPLPGASGLGPGAHVCWVYDDSLELAGVAGRYLADGLAQGARVLLVGDGPLDSVAAGLPAAPRDAVRVMRVEDAYTAGSVVVPEEQLAFYAAETRAARAAGYTGLRVFAEVTALVTDPAGVGEHVRWEHLADDYMAGGSGLAALCAYRAGAVAEETLTELESVHPLVRDRAGHAPFRLFFDEGRLALAGTVDAFGADRLARTLAATHVAGPVVTLDLAALEFADASGCATVAAFAERLRGRSAELRVASPPAVFRRVWDVLGYDRLPNVTLGPVPA